jgi:exodeoxyribonuclease-3
VKIIGWNVNGIRAIIKKGFLEFIKKEDPDILCLQEIKIHEEPENITEEMQKLGYMGFWNFAKKPGYSGTATFVKLTSTTPGVKEASTPGVNRVICGIGDEKFDTEGRVITLEFDNFYLINTYFPNTQKGLARLDYKMEFNEKFLEFTKNICSHSESKKNHHFVSLREDPTGATKQSTQKILDCHAHPSADGELAMTKKPIIICGDLNVAHKEIDLANPKQNVKNAGFTPQERSFMDKLLDAGYIDTFRQFTSDGGHYTWWSHFANSRTRNIGWRIDYFITSNNLKNDLKSSIILPQIMGSDHAPVVIEINL